MAKTIRLTMAQALVKFLNNQYIEFDGKENRMFKGIFTIFGHGNVIGLGQALEEDPGELTVHQGRNEQGMAHAAMGYAKQKLRKQIYACTSSVGPGAANMVTAAATATANCIPVLFLPGDVYATRQPDPVLQQMEQPSDLSISTNDAFRAVSKYWDRIARPEQLMSACISAMRVLTDPADTGAVTIALPQDVEGEAYDYPEYFFTKRVHRIDRRPPTKAMIEDAVKAIRSHKNPILICGGGVKYSEAWEEFRNFAHKFNIPFGETQAGRGAIVWDDEMNLGGIGETGGLAANVIAKKADLVIGVGTRYTDFTTSSKWLFQNPDVKFLNINVSEFHAYKLDGIQVVADAKAALEAISETLEKTGGYKSTYTSEIAAAKEEYNTEIDRVYGVEYTGKGFVPEIDDHLDREKVFEEVHNITGSYLTQSYALGVLNDFMKNDYVVVGSSGSLPGDLQRAWRVKEQNSYHVEYGFSCMGYEVNAALGVKLAEPDKEVYSFVGDGSYMMLHSELPTSIQEHKKINIILFDNMAFGCINNLEMEHGMDSFGTEFRFRDEKTNKLTGGLVPIDFAMNAASYGCKTYKVTTADELKEALEDAAKQTVSTLIDIKVLPKTMVHKYGSWWRVGVAQTSKNQRIRKVYKEISLKIDEARKY
ncbi:3D-(3,5/4)-trihydroxycyclohexane-1,2-dione acylhydrolase (decyclizing) [Pectinatus haikarae]|uniref:3D-(3,5/4)-trihydroxycyclohexane-1,2-dione acylhydrolase (Decyclizing) n=1 Tax=Pectinatus haikarae TaxID=349096 RepID=A0ABT9Y8J4_9FIRM|nr:3D-(3,5/4)-trihydroxycyclohexane-1,2-dione acylhydrolase (decyclizing) [Pectinatus haikarae]MDQ0204153.1 3D-(3,5/4)-trihydroxycyclohexane-1,2-dione acylhydrolase (decyclizing) [Pectinatus haikarae]